MTQPFFRVHAWPLALQLAVLLLTLVGLGIVAGRVLSEPDLAPGLGGIPLADPEIRSQLARLYSQEPVGNTELVFQEFNRIGSAQDLAESGKGVLVATFDGPHDVNRLRFELWKDREVASERLDGYEAYGKKHPRYYDVLDPAMGTWARFCLNSDLFGIECFARVENAVIRGRIIDKGGFEYPDLDKLDAGLLVSTGVKYWMTVFGDTTDTS